MYFMTNYRRPTNEMEVARRRHGSGGLALVTINLLLTSTTTALSMPAPSNGPLSRLAATDGAAPVHRAGHSYEVKDKGGVTSGKYCKYDDIRAMLTASRARSYSQGRDGCCGKAAEHLGLSGPPPPGSPWSRNAPATASRSNSLVSSMEESCVDEDATRDASLEHRHADFVGTGW
jgi:hypothetical protein